jgi:ketosteroid isomerase-like protein
MNVVTLVLALFISSETPPEIQTFLDSFVASFENLDWERFRALFSDDATVFFPPPYASERASGRAAVEEGFRAVFDRWRSERRGPPYIEIDPRDLEVQSYGDVAVVTFHLAGSGALSRRTLVLRREQGSFKIVHLHASSG